jgi:hypothetical protein
VFRVKVLQAEVLKLNQVGAQVQIRKVQVGLEDKNQIIRNQGVVDQDRQKEGRKKDKDLNFVIF